MTRAAYLVDGIRSPFGRYGGGLSGVRADDLAGQVIAALVARASIPADRIDDVIFGCANQAGEDNRNVARMAALLAGLPVSVPGVTVNRLCGSGLQAIAQTAQRIVAGEDGVFVAGGVECISTVQNTINQHMLEDSWMLRHHPAIYMPMLQTAENVARRYGIDRERQDRYGAESQQRAAAAQAAGRFNDEIVPITVRQAVADPATRAMGTREVTLSADEGIRADTTYEGVARIRTALPGGVISAGNASQFSDGASASVLMSAAEAARRRSPACTA